MSAKPKAAMRFTERVGAKVAPRPHLDAPPATPERRIRRALDIAFRWGGIVDDTWTLDQMVRALTGCTIVQDQAKDESTEYTDWVNARQDPGDMGIEEEWKWNKGTAP